MTMYFNFLIFLFSFFRPTGAGGPYGVLYKGQVPEPESMNLVERGFDDTYIHDISWQVLDDALFSVDFEGTEGSVESEASVTLECLNCWTVGTINATAASTGIDSAQLSVEFQDVQASFDLALLMNGEQTLSIPIYERGVKHTAGHFSFDVKVGLDVVFQVDDQVNLTGGFQVILPDTAYIVADMGISLESGNIEFNVNHDFNGTQVDALPLAADATVSLTTSLRASIDIDGLVMDTLGSETVKGSIGGGLYFIPAQYIVQLTLEESSSVQELEAVETFDMNFGYYYGGALQVADISYSSFPANSTTFFQAGPWTQTIVSTRAEAERTSVPLVEFTCPSDLSTETGLTTRQYTAYKCLISVPNCPPGFEQTIVATHVEIVSSIICPQATHTGGAAATSTLDPQQAAISPGAISSAIQMTPLADPVVNSISLPDTTPTGLAPNITAQFLPITVPSTTTSLTKSRTISTAIPTTTKSAASRVTTPLLSCLFIGFIAIVVG